MSKPTEIPNVLFFSKKCKTCTHFITMCQQNKILKYFKLIDVDDKIKEYASQGLKVVPTVMARGLSKPIEGKDVFTWLESVLSIGQGRGQKINTPDEYLPETGINGIQQKTSMQNNSNNPNNNVVKRNVIQPPIINTSNNQNNQNNSNIQNKIPDVKIVNGVQINTVQQKNQPFGYLQDEMSGFSDTFAYLMTDNPLPKAFLPHDKDLQIYTAPEGDKLNNKQQDSLMKSVEMIRNNDEKLFISQIENEHKKLVNSK